MSKLWIIIPASGAYATPEYAGRCLNSVKLALERFKGKYGIVCPYDNDKYKDMFQISGSDKEAIVTILFENKMIEEDDVITFIDADDTVSEDYFEDDISSEYIQYTDALKKMKIMYVPESESFDPDYGYVYENIDDVPIYTGVIDLRYKWNLKNISSLKSQIFGDKPQCQMWGYFYPADVVVEIIKLRDNLNIRTAGMWEDFVWNCLLIASKPEKKFQKRKGTYRYEVHEGSMSNINPNNMFYRVSTAVTNLYWGRKIVTDKVPVGLVRNARKMIVSMLYVLSMESMYDDVEYVDVWGNSDGISRFLYRYGFEALGGSGVDNTEEQELLLTLDGEYYSEGGTYMSPGYPSKFLDRRGYKYKIVSNEEDW